MSLWKLLLLFHSLQKCARISSARAANKVGFISTKEATNALQTVHPGSTEGKMRSAINHTVTVSNEFPYFDALIFRLIAKCKVANA